jgi:hypothetical protein
MSKQTDAPADPNKARESHPDNRAEKPKHKRKKLTKADVEKQTRK